MNWMRISLFGALLLSAWPAHGQAPNPVPVPAPAAAQVKFECRWTAQPIVLDGKADEPAWKTAPVIDQFIVPWEPKGPRPAATKTTARILWDADYFYFHADMEDADLYADVTENDGEIWKNDVFELFFKPSPQHGGYYEFEVNAAGAVLDMFLPRRDAGGFKRFIKEGTFHLEHKIALRGTLNDWADRDEGWSVEGRLPWTDFVKTGGRPEPGETWTFALCRYDYSVDLADGMELSTIAPLKGKNFHLHEDYVPLTFIGPEATEAARMKEVLGPVLAGLSTKVKGSPEPPAPYLAERVYPELKLSGLIDFNFVPGTGRMVFIDRSNMDEGSRLRSIDLKTGELVTLMEADQLLYTVEFHPKFAENGFLYIGHNGPITVPRPQRMSRITRYTMNLTTGVIDSASAFVLLEWKSGGHDGSAIAFGKDGMMYITTGDGTNDSDENVAGQGMDHLLSKVLRIDVDHPEPGKPYAIPADNPFLGTPGARGETWAYGLRNPWRMTCDSQTGQIWVGNNGQDVAEQVYLIEKGSNYGWSVFEGSRPFYQNRKLGPTPHVPPTIEHLHHESRSLTGGVVYYGKPLPDLNGAYVYGDNSTGKIWAAKHDGTKLQWQAEIADTLAKITAFRVSPAGDLIFSDYVGNDEGGLYRLVPNPAAAAGANSEFPRQLSETGLFKDVAANQVQPGVLSYSVSAPQWADGAVKTRHLALPPDAGKIGFKGRGFWELPDNAVIFETLSYPMDDAKPQERTRLETRLMVRQQGEWSGFTYRWNPEQTDAVLVDKDGADFSFPVKTVAGGERTQKWHVPSRTECLMCHTRASGFVLGLQTAQLNRDHDYGGGMKANQLEALHEAGLITTNWRRDALTAQTSEFQQRKRVAQEAGNNELVAELERQWRQQTASRDQRPAKGGAQIMALSRNGFDSLVDPSDITQPLEARVRSYLHANCSSCHQHSGGGNSTIDLRAFISTEDMNLIGKAPHHGTLGLGDDALLIAPGNPAKSILPHRISLRGAGQMPPVGSTQPDPQAMVLFLQWIASQKPQ